MSKYSSQIADQDFPTQVASIRIRLSEVPPEIRDVLKVAVEGELERLELLLDRVLQVVVAVPPEVVPEEKPGQLTDSLSRITAALEGLGDPMQVANSAPQITTEVNNLATQLWQWQGFAAVTNQKDSLAEAATFYRRSVGQQLRSVHEELDELRGAVHESQQEVAKLQDNIDKATAAARANVDAVGADSNQRLTALQERISGLVAQIQESIARQEESTRQNQQQFSDSQEKRVEEFAVLLDQSRRSLTDAQIELKSMGEKSLKLIKAQIESAREMTSVFAGGGTGYAFGKEAEQQAKAAGLWRIVTVILGLAGAALIVVVLMLFGNRVSMAELTSRLAIAAVVAGVAGYAASQSALHRRREANSRRAELLLVSFDPLTQKLPDEKRQEARLELLKDLTAGISVPDRRDVKPEPVITTSQVSLIGQLFEPILKLLKR